MYLISNNPEECYGCGACYNACSKHAISFRVSDDTYRYPVIDKNMCIDCGECRRVCPSQKIMFDYPKVCVAAVTKDLGDWERSSSGGAFKVIALAAKERCEKQGLNFYLCGCIWGENFKATHKLLKVSCEKDVDVFCKSKYVQSDLLMVYREIKDVLKDEKNYVLFSGTPCQVAALKLFLGRDGNTRLFLIDLICHGAPGQMIFDKYIKNLENEHHSELMEYSFRNKKILDNGTIYTRSSKMILKNGEEHLVTRFTDDYLKLFYTAGYHFRPACYPCQFKRPERVGDITIGDAWNIDKIYPELNPFHGVSLIVINTVVGGEYKSDIEKRMNVFSLDYHFAVHNNKPLREPDENVAPKIILKEFFTDILDKDKSFKHSAEKYFNAISELKNKK